MRIPRSRGAVSGVLLVILGAWGALVPFIGHYFDFVIGADRAWDWTAGRFWLSVLPGAVVFVGGVLLLMARTRPSGGLGAWLGVVGGAWFVTGQHFSELWNHGVPQTGPALGGTGHRVAEQLAYFTGLGALIVAIAAFALGRMAVRSVRDAELAAAEETAAADGARTTAHTGQPRRFGRQPVAEDQPAAQSEPVATTNGPADRTQTLSAADRVREVATSSRGRGLFRRNR